jgi:tRNA pseudouridine38-40 synthase
MPLDPERMQLAANPLIGEHDFSAYRASQCQAKHAVRKITAITVSGRCAETIVIDVQGNAFLHNMVRIIAGTLVDIGRGHLSVDAALNALNAHERSLAGQTAPGHGLTLMRVDYSPTPFEADKCWP